MRTLTRQRGFYDKKTWDLWFQKHVKQGKFWCYRIPGIIFGDFQEGIC